MTPRYLKKYRESLPKKEKRPSCAFASILRRMPPLVHRPAADSRFFVSHSVVNRFIIFVMGGDPREREAWCAAQKLFYQARSNHVIIYDRRTRKWQGCEYRGSVSPDIRQLLNLTNCSRFSKRDSTGDRPPKSTPPP